MLRSDIEDQFSVFYEYPREYFKDGMTFTIVESYWVRQGFVKREFAPDIHIVVLKDENGVLSVCSIRKITSIKTNTLGELE